jgi:hypothetical protein
MIYCVEQKIGLLPDHQANPRPIFQAVAVHLFGPLEYQGPHRWSAFQWTGKANDRSAKEANAKKPGGER